MPPAAASRSSNMPRRRPQLQRLLPRLHDVPALARAWVINATGGLRPPPPRLQRMRRGRPIVLVSTMVPRFRRRSDSSTRQIACRRYRATARFNARGPIGKPQQLFAAASTAPALPMASGITAVHFDPETDAATYHARCPTNFRSRAFGCWRNSPVSRPPGTVPVMMKMADQSSTNGAQISCPPLSLA